MVKNKKKTKDMKLKKQSVKKKKDHHINMKMPIFTDGVNTYIKSTSRIKNAPEKFSSKNS